MMSIAAALHVATFAAAKLEDHSAAWGAAGLSEQVAAGHEDSLPEPLLAELSLNLRKVVGESQGGLTFDKKSTWWLPLGSEPESAIEAAVHELYRLDFGGARTPVVGAEWWVQDHDVAKGSIRFHYDKDEAYASGWMTMRFPEVSTVTYLTDSGGPTLVLNQTTPDGNEEVPVLPARGALVHPRRNKHLVFRGNLQHGVDAELAQPSELGARRTTLLINWWRQAPLPPNCKAFGRERWKRLGLYRSTEAVEALRRRDAQQPAARRIGWEEMALRGGGARLHRMRIEIAPTRMYHLDVDVSRGGNWRVGWEVGHALGPIDRLDLKHKNCVGTLFSNPKPKLFIVLDNGGSADWRATLPEWTARLLDEHSSDFVFVAADPVTTADFMQHMGLRGDDAPTAVIHDTKREAKHRMSEPFGEEAVGRFIRRFLGQHDEL